MSTETECTVQQNRQKKPAAEQSPNLFLEIEIIVFEWHCETWGIWSGYVSHMFMKLIARDVSKIAKNS